MGRSGGVGGGGAGPINLTLAPVINGVADARDMFEQLRGRAYELAEIVRGEIDRRDRARH
ncbi:MAG: hypothetical protein IPL88_14655 [Rhizobiales bacterium]|nr:hypothetical protein [Hyphomicrobiales bacterium]